MNIVVATYIWFDPDNKHNAKYQYGADDVRLLKRMVSRHLSVPHEFAVITDMGDLFANDADIRVIKPDMTTHVPRTCFRRLFTFHPDGAKLIGERVLQLDLDTVIVGSMDSIASRTVDLVLWRNPGRVPWENPTKTGRPYYNTSLVLHRCGTMPEIWQDFNPDRGPMHRDDQWYLSDKLGPTMSYVDGSDGVYRLARDDTPGSGVSGELPANARVIFFPGSDGKWFEPHIAQENPWILEHRV